MAKPTRPPINSSAFHIFDILRLVSTADVPLGVTDIGRQLNLPNSTVHRALATLEQSQYIARLESAPRYKLGPMPQFLTRAIFRRFALRKASIPYLKEIAQLTGETTFLSVRIGNYYMRIAVAYGSNDIYSPGRLGEVRLLHDGSAGLGILAFLPERDVRDYRQFVLKHHPAFAPALRRRCSRAQLAQSVAAGFVIEPQRDVADNLIAAKPIHNAGGQAIASILATGPRSRSPQPDWLKPAYEFERLVRGDAASFEHPYAHIDMSETVIDISGLSSEVSGRMSPEHGQRD